MQTAPNPAPTVISEKLKAIRNSELCFQHVFKMLQDDYYQTEHVKRAQDSLLSAYSETMHALVKGDLKADFHLLASAEAKSN